MIRTLTFFTNAGGEQSIAVQNYETSERFERYGDAYVAVGGKVHHKSRGARRVYRIEYDKSVEADTYRSIINNIITDLEGGEETITLSEGSDLSAARVVVPTEDFEYFLAYGNQIGNFLPAMEFEDVNINSVLGGWVETGWVESGWVEMGS